MGKYLFLFKNEDSTFFEFFIHQKCRKKNQLVEVSYNVRTLVMNKRNRLENAFFSLDGFNDTKTPNKIVESCLTVLQYNGQMDVLKENCNVLL